MCSRDEVLWIALAVLAGCGFQHQAPAVRQDSCVGVADGGFAYPITGRLVDAASGAPVCCVYLDLEGHVGSDVPGFPALGRVITGNDGAFETELHTRMAWGTCIREDGSLVPPPEAPELTDLSISVNGADRPVELSGARISQERTDPGKRWLDIGTVRAVDHPFRPCDSAKKDSCPLPAEQLRAEPLQ